MTEQTTSRSELFLTLECQGKYLGLPALMVSEIIEHVKIAPFPRAPKEISGLIHFRGDVLPIIHLGARLGLGQVVPPNVIVIIKHESGHLNHMYGLAADSVSKAIDFSEDDLKHDVDMGSEFRTDYLSGVGRTDARFIPILNLDQVANPTELAQIVGLSAAR